jgi:pyruvoyl-dependent arginine decarboxylase (PvlArgDC)
VATANPVAAAIVAQSFAADAGENIAADTCVAIQQDTDASGYARAKSAEQGLKVDEDNASKVCCAACNSAKHSDCKASASV